MSIPDFNFNITDMPDIEINPRFIYEDLENLNANERRKPQREFNYKLLSNNPFATGGQASLFDIEDTVHPGVPLCLKAINVNHVLGQVKGENPEKVLERYNMEINNLMELRHCINVVNLNCCFASASMYDEEQKIKYSPDERGYMYLIMEKLTPLTEYIDSLMKKLEKAPNRDQRLLSLFKKLTIDICLALMECEKQHILHRDVKLGNILVRENADANPDFVLADFGVSRKDVKGKVVTQMVTPSRTAPEIVYGIRLHNYNSDIYSLGCSIRDLLRYLDNPADCPEYKIFDNVIAKAEEINPQNRYKNANEMLEDLKDKLSYDYAKKLLCDSKSDEALDTAYKTLENSKNSEEKTNCRRLIAIIKHNKAYNSNSSEKTKDTMFIESLNEMSILASKERDVKASFFYFHYWLQNNPKFDRQEFNSKYKFLEYSAKMGFAPAQFEYGIFLQAGEWVNKDETLGLAYIKKAIEQDYFGAKRYLIDHIGDIAEKINLPKDKIQIIKEEIKNEKEQRAKDILKFI